LEHSFIFRKLGVVYDYISRPGDFPRSTLPKADEAKADKPNPFGIGTGMAESAISTCLLLSGYLTRMELGMAGGDDERILDRLVAGLIRLGTVGPRGQLIGGLAPDSRSFYSACAPAGYTAYAHGMLHACLSPALALESQGKLRDICGRWVARQEKDDFALPGLDLENPLHLWEARIRRLHMLTVARHVSDNPRWQELYDQYAGEEDGAWLKPELPAECTDPEQLLSLQLALHDLAESEEVAERLQPLQLLRRKIGHRLQTQLGAYKNFNPEQPIEEAVLDWREDLPEGAASADPLSLRAAVLEAWPRLKHEAETVGAAASAGLAILLSGDADLMTEHAEAMAAMQEGVAWDQVWSIQPLRAFFLLHALGADRGFWSEDQVAQRQTDEAEAALDEDPDAVKEGDMLNRIGSRFGYEYPEGYEEVPLDGPPPKGAGRRGSLFPKSILAKERGGEKSGGGRSGGRRNRRSRGRNRPPRSGEGKGESGGKPASGEGRSSGGEKRGGEGGAKGERSQGNRRRNRGRRNRNRRPRSGEGGAQGGGAKGDGQPRSSESKPSAGA
jgi:hypothetical protein